MLKNMILLRPRDVLEMIFFCHDNVLTVGTWKSPIWALLTTHHSTTNLGSHIISPFCTVAFLMWKILSLKRFLIVWKLLIWARMPKKIRMLPVFPQNCNICFIYWALNTKLNWMCLFFSIPRLRLLLLFRCKCHHEGYFLWCSDGTCKSHSFKLFTKPAFAKKCFFPHKFKIFPPISLAAPWHHINFY